VKDYPYWWESAGKPKPFPNVKLPKSIDVVVVGAGLTGLTASLYLAKAGKSVIVLDQSIPCIGASSRNGGMIGGGHRANVDGLIETYSLDLTKRLLHEMHIDSTHFAKQLMQEENIDCDFQETGRFQAFWKASEYALHARKLEQLKKLVPVEAEMVSPLRQTEEVKSQIYHGGIKFNLHGGLNPAKWVYGIRDAAIAYDVMLLGDTEVKQINNRQGSHQVMTSRGVITAQDVLIATNGYSPRNFGSLSHRIFPIPSFIVTTEELSETQIRDLFPNLRMIVETRERHCYYRPSPDRKRIVFGGRAAMFKVSDRLYQNQLRGLLTEIFPELRGVSFTHSWWGNTGFTFELLPHVGQFDGIWHAMGYCGNGNGMAPWLGYKVAHQILGYPEGETAFAEIDMPTKWYYKGYPWFLPIADLGFRCRDTWSNLRKNTHN